jgi:hypothetical protein
MAAFSLTEVSPVIAEVIMTQYRQYHDFIPFDDMTAALMNHHTGKVLIQNAQKYRHRHPGEYAEQCTDENIAQNMIALFSGNFTQGNSQWRGVFERKKINGEWAYRPILK